MCLIAYIHMVKNVLKPCGTLKTTTYHHTPQQTFMAAHSIDTNLMVVISFFATPLIY